MKRLLGIGVSGGRASGRALILKHRALEIRFYIHADEVAREVDRLMAARDRSKAQLQAVKARVAQAAGSEHAYIFDAQLLMLDDPMLTGRAADLIRARCFNAEWALQSAADEWGAIFDQVQDPYLRERRGDVADVVGRFKMNLRGAAANPSELLTPSEGPYVLIADELAPSVAAQIDWARIVGFATDAGSWTYHTAILARSLRVPAVIGLHDVSATVAPGTTVIVDGAAGELIVDPPAELIAESRPDAARPRQRRRSEPRQRPLRTADGVAIRLEANIELPGDARKAIEAGAMGIGLYRSEYLLARRSLDALGEDAQYDVYRYLLEQMAPAPVTIRTFDAREEQLIARRLDSALGVGGQFGLHAIRLSLAFQEPFRRQLRALLRAAAHGRLRILFPFVTGLEELREARRILADARRELGDRTPHVPIGVMIEVPGAALTAGHLAREADFFSVGTNDLIQYCLAADRTDRRVANLYEPLHPAVLKLIRVVRRAGQGRGIPVAVCGEMAADPTLLTVLIGLGITEFSMTPSAIPLVAEVVRGVRRDEMRRVAAQLLRQPTAADARALLAALPAPDWRGLADEPAVGAQ